MKHEKPIYTYTPEEFSDLVDECIAKCKDDNDEYQPCPEQLYQHVKLSKQTISGYRNAKPSDTAYPYKLAAERFYNFLGIFACKDNREGNGRQGAHINNRVLKYSEKVEHEVTDTTDALVDKLKEASKEELIEYAKKKGLKIT